jgi:hypothetical protein
LRKVIFSNRLLLTPPSSAAITPVFQRRHLRSTLVRAALGAWLKEIAGL